MDNMTAERPESGVDIPAGWHERLWNDVRARTLRGDKKTVRVNRTPNGTTIAAVQRPPSPGGAAAAEPRVHNGGSHTASYEADFENGEIHLISISGSGGTFAISAKNVPLGQSLILRMQNPNAQKIYFNDKVIMEYNTSYTSVIVFANLIGDAARPRIYSRLVEVS